MHIELRRVKQMLVNNCYPIAMVDKYIKKAPQKQIDSQASIRENEAEQTGQTHKLFYHNSMSPSYKTDEKVLRAIVKKHCKPTVSGEQLNPRP